MLLTPTLINDLTIRIGSLVPLNIHCLLLALISNDDIKAIIFAGNASSAPGPNGFSFEFYKHSWHLIGEKVWNIVMSFFSTGYLHRGAKASVITLIPKNSHVLLFLILDPFY